MSQYKDAQDTYQFPDTVKGTSVGAQVFEVLVNNAAPTSNLQTVVCKFAKDGVVTLTPDVTINDAATWNFTVGPMDGMDTAIAEGLHVGDIKLTAADGKVNKWIKVELNILPSPQ